MRIAVAGGTGTVGRHVVAALAASGHEPVVLSRSRGVDVVTGQGLDGALRDVDAVVDVSGPTTSSRRASRAFFTAATQRLHEAEVRAGVRHHVVLSIVGVDRVGLGYYVAKLAQERLVLEGPVPSTVLRATQFHEFAGQWLDRVPGPVVVVPRMRTRPVAAREAGDVLAELAVGPALGAAGDLAGPEEHEMTDLVRRTARARGDRRPVVGVRLPLPAARAAATGGLLPAAAARLGTVTFGEHLLAPA